MLMGSLSTDVSVALTCVFDVMRVHSVSLNWTARSLLEERRVVKHELRVVSGDLVEGVFHGVGGECKHVSS